MEYENSSTRRGFLGAMAALPVIAMPALPAIASGTSEWSRAIARYRAADAAWDAYIEQTYNPAVDAMEARAPVPPRTFTVTARSGQTVDYRFNPLAPDDWEGHIGIISEKARDLADRWEAYQRAIPGVRRDLGMDRIEATESAFAHATAKAREAAMSAQPADVTEAVEKGEFFREFADGSDISDERFGSLLADLRRLAAH